MPLVAVTVREIATEIANYYNYASAFWGVRGGQVVAC